MAEAMNDERRPKTLVRAAAATYATNLSAAGFSLLNVILIARVLGPSGRGQVAFLIAVSTMTALTASLSVEEANANLGGTCRDARSSLVTNSVLLSIVLGLAAGLLVGLLVLAAPVVGGHANRGLLWLVLATTPMIILQLYLKYLLQADYRFVITNLAWVISPALTATINVVLALLGLLTVRSAMIVWVTTNAVPVLILLVAACRLYGLGRPDPALARRSLSCGLQAHFGRFMGMGNYRADQWVLGAMAGPHALGLYSIAVSLAEALFYVPGVIVLLQRPDLVRAGSGDAAALAARIFRRAVVLSAGAGAALFLAAPFLCVAVFGPQFAGSVPELRVLALGAAGIVALQLLGNAVIAQRAPLLASVADGVALVVTVVLLLLLIPPLGGLGAAIATTAAYTVGGVVMAVIFLRVLNADARDLIPRPADVSWYWAKARAELLLLRRRPA
ncbi:MAG: lipopolysaccharide biosynthesis protein [Solirubrobacteraceae bacterium]